MTDHISLVYVETKTKLSGLVNWVWFVMKTRQDNDVTHCIGAIYVENDNEVSWSIEPIAVCD